MPKLEKSMEAACERLCAVVLGVELKHLPLHRGRGVRLAIARRQTLESPFLHHYHACHKSPDGHC